MQLVLSLRPFASTAELETAMNAFAFDASSQKPQSQRWEQECADQQFLELMRDLRSRGGMLPIEEVRAVSYVCNPGSSVSKLLMENMVFSVMWRRQHWIPCFQFSSLTWLPIVAVSSLVQKLKPSMRGVELAMWFITTDPFLNGKSPLEQFNIDIDHVQKFAAHSLLQRQRS
jgi:hypothetical protein